MARENLTKAETVALWHAVDSLRRGIQFMQGVGCTPEQIQQERGRLAAANRALRKVNELRGQGL